MLDSQIVKPSWYSHEYCYWHDPGQGAGYLPVGPDIEPLHSFGVDPDLRRVEGFLRASGLLDRFDCQVARTATTDELLLVHTANHVAHIDRISAQGGGETGAYAPVGYHSSHAARLATGAVVQAATNAMNNQGCKHYCFIRPAGHHAEVSRSMALCLFNNVAVGVRAAMEDGAERVLILDWDVHHGNGTQSIFYDDPNVLYISLHQDGLFPPRSGTIREMGIADGYGTTINVPMLSGSGHGAYLAAMHDIVCSAAEIFQPDVIFVSAGLDASAHDPMGRQMCHSHTFYEMTQIVCQLANMLCEGRLIVVHEGGYSQWYSGILVRAVAAALANVSAPSDPFLHALKHMPGQQLLPQQAQRVTQIVKQHPLYRRQVV